MMKKPRFLLKRHVWSLLLVFLCFGPAPAFADEAAWERHNSAGIAAYRKGDYAEAIRRFEVALKEAKAFGEEDPRFADALNNLAELYKAQGRYAEAEPLYKRSLVILKKVLGPEHPRVALGLNNLAGLYESQGRYAEAEPLYKRSLVIGEKTLSPEHPNVAATLNNLAALYQTQGRYAEAETLHKRSLAIKENSPGCALRGG